MTCPICNDTKIIHTATGIWPCKKCKDKPKDSSNIQYKNSHLYCMFDGLRLKEISLGFLKCTKCQSIFLPSQLSNGRKKIEEICNERLEEK